MPYPWPSRDRPTQAVCGDLFSSAQEIANLEQRLVRIESKLNLLITLVVTILVFVLGAAATILFR